MLESGTWTWNQHPNSRGKPYCVPYGLHRYSLFDFSVSQNLHQGIDCRDGICPGDPSTGQIMCDPVGLWQSKILRF